MADPTEPPAKKTERRLSVFVSSVVYGYEDFLETVYALLEGYGYDVVMSHKGTVPVDPSRSAMDSCLEAVDRCDLFLGFILPRYGSGKEDPKGQSITHKEQERAIHNNMPRWFLVHEHVVIARQLLLPFRDDSTPVVEFRLKDGIDFKPTPVLSDLRVLEMYEAAMRHDISRVADRTGNWVQPYGPEDDARLFATAQFRRYRELFDKHLPKLKDPASLPKVRGRGAK